MKQFYTPISIAIAAGVIAVVTFLSINLYVQAYSNQMNQANKNTAVDGCLKSSLYRNVTTETKENTVTTTEEALSTAVDKCMKMKGY